MSNRYDDIINLPHHRSTRHQPMTLYNRAAQFAPFAALNGHDDAINETARLTSQRIELSADEMMQLSQALSQAMAEQATITVTHFVADTLKQGGHYEQHVGCPKRIDDYDHSLLFTDGTSIPLADIHSIKN